MSSEAGGARRRRSCHEKYEAFASDAAARLRSSALGTDVVNGYTTPEHARRMADALDLADTSRLLDLGSGRGWPGGLIARATGCELVVCDLPMNALSAALEGLRASELSSRASVVRADGVALPFSDRSFDAACHADVLC